MIDFGWLGLTILSEAVSAAIEYSKVYPTRAANGELGAFSRG
jgi:hypothetical protein